MEPLWKVRSYNNTELKNKITKQTLHTQAKTHTVTSVYIEKDSRKKYKTIYEYQFENRIWNMEN
jgi:hypothetical protein